MKKIVKGLAWLLMALCALAIAGYAGLLLATPEARPPFARELFGAAPLRTASHLLGGMLALLGGALQMNAWLRVAYPAVHRWTGRLYVLAVLGGGAAGLVMAFHAFGGPAARLGFGMLALAWLGTTCAGWRHIRAGRRNAHRDWMIRSYALTLAAVTLRIYIPLSQVNGLPFEEAYRAIAWLCWVPNLVAAEWFIRARLHGSARIAVYTKTSDDLPPSPC